jgi:hypothetical protein
MQKTLKHGGVEYDTNLLVSIKGQGTNIRIATSECVSNASTIVSSDIKKPILVNHEGTLLILIDTAEVRGNKSFDAVLLSKHILKKAKVVQEQVRSPVTTQSPAQRAMAVLTDRVAYDTGRSEPSRYQSPGQGSTWIPDNLR